MKDRILLLVLAGFAACAGCRRVDERDFTISVPTVKEADMPVVAAAFAPYGGILKDTVRFDAAKHEITLRYDSMQIAKKNIEMALAEIGFEANGVKPETVPRKDRR